MAEGALWEFWADKRIGSEGSAKPVRFVPESVCDGYWYSIQKPLPYASRSRVMCLCGPLPRRRLHRANRAGGRRISGGLMYGLLAAQGWDLYDEETTRRLIAAQNINVEAGNGVCCACVIQSNHTKKRQTSQTQGLCATAECKLVTDRYARARGICVCRHV